MKIEILKHPTDQDWLLCKKCTLVTVGKDSEKMPTDECNARGEIINNQAQQLREKDAKILDLYNQLCPALKKHLDDFNELVELRGKVTAYEAEIAVYKAQIEKFLEPTEYRASNGTKSQKQEI